MWSNASVCRDGMVVCYCGVRQRKVFLLVVNHNLRQHNGRKMLIGLKARCWCSFHTNEDRMGSVIVLLRENVEAQLWLMFQGLG